MTTRPALRLEAAADLAGRDEAVRRDGFAYLPALLDAAEVRQLRAAMDRVEGQLLRNYGPMFEVDPAGLEAYPGESPTTRQIVHERLNLSPEQMRILETWGQSQCGRATATGVGWAAAAAYIERATGQPADWERMVR